MKVREFLEYDGDIDVYDNVCEELGICFCGPMRLTEMGLDHFSEVLEYEIEIEHDPLDESMSWAIVDVDGPEGVWQKKLKRAKEFFEACAGYCDADDYDTWFVEE